MKPFKAALTVRYGTVWMPPLLIYGGLCFVYGFTGYLKEIDVLPESDR